MNAIDYINYSISIVLIILILPMLKFAMVALEAEIEKAFGGELYNLGVTQDWFESKASRTWFVLLIDTIICIAS